ncbi:uncharacterized protein ARMOST_16345 [Armillaria ostoyae]|uniref:Uncharacterized protein n=1 Tax=Armillaria ostoyae TaxID=47428 RepID=A0A284RVX0_ARMOS|nr:uncharacterized protein ARMOST_16345 [Armillaria ostoyae]
MADSNVLCGMFSP